MRAASGDEVALSVRILTHRCQKGMVLMLRHCLWSTVCIGAKPLYNLAMSRMDPECFPTSSSDDRQVCAACFDDKDLKDIIRGHGGPRGCAFCGRKDAATAPFAEVLEHIADRLHAFYGNAVDQLPHDSREGGYQGWQVDTYDLLMDEIAISLPRDNDETLWNALFEGIGDDTWCKHDWLILEPDKSLKYSWEAFCDIVKYRRRFFFQHTGVDPDDASHPDSRSPLQLLDEMCSIAGELGLIRRIPSGDHFYRTRARKLRERFVAAADLGPPPKEVALQSNRMNPPGISMFYGANRPGLAMAEARATRASTGKFETLRPILLLDLVHLPRVPGFFSAAERIEIYTLSFMHEFSSIITKPVPGDNRVNVDYIPTQVFTEFLRDYPFKDGHLDGLMYPSATGCKGWNVVLFAGPYDVEGVLDPDEHLNPPAPWLRMKTVRHT